MPQRSCAGLHHQSAIRVNGSRKNGFVVTVSTRALNGGRGASVAACAAVAWGCAPRADRPAAALVPSTSHGAARIMIELRNKHTLTGYAAFRSYFARSSAAISLAKA